MVHIRVSLVSPHIVIWIGITHRPIIEPVTRSPLSFLDDLLAYSNVLSGIIWSPFIHLSSNILQIRYHLSEKKASAESSVILFMAPILYPMVSVPSLRCFATLNSLLHELTLSFYLSCRSDTPATSSRPVDPKSQSLFSVSPPA